MNYKEAAASLKALGEETRLKIVAYLTEDTFCVCELVVLLDMSQPSISQHMKRLKDELIILEEKRGRWTYYQLNKAHPMYDIILTLSRTLPSKQEKITALTASGQRAQCNE